MNADNHDSSKKNSDKNVIHFVVNDFLELNLSWMPFIKEGALFVASAEDHAIGEYIWVNLTLPNKADPILIEGRVVWITPKNALHHVLAGVGVQLIGPNAADMRRLIESNLDPSVEVGGYAYGMTDEGVTKN